MGIVDEDRLREWAHDGETETASLPHPLPSTDLDRHCFLVVRHRTAVKLFNLPSQGEFLFGRSEEVDVVIDDARASFRHARLSITPGELHVEDLGSRNGTYLNGQLLPDGPAQIRIGDTLEIGGAQIILAIRAAQQASSAELGLSDAKTDVALADPEMLRVYGSARKIAPMTTTVLILGETGTGKDVLARYIHAWSPRADKPFMCVNCAGIPDSLIESELFGYDKGAFTGADRRRAGYFEAAHGGTIFLDEIGDLSPSAQVKLLHALENRTVTRLGGTESVPIDVRIVSATHRDLPAAVAAGGFRSDLYYRISPFVIRIPPLRDRRIEIPLLANIFIRQFADTMRVAPPAIAPDAFDLLVKRAWPGNVRELKNAVERAFAMAEGGTLTKENFIEERPTSSQSEALDRRRARVDWASIEEALRAEDGNQTRAAARLGIARRTLVYRLAQYRREAARRGIDGED
jgi:DNA-binding NtrC family response regulator